MRACIDQGKCRYALRALCEPVSKQRAENFAMCGARGGFGPMYSAAGGSCRGGEHWPAAVLAMPTGFRRRRRRIGQPDNPAPARAVRIYRTAPTRLTLSRMFVAPHFFSSCSPPDHQVVHRINSGVGPNARWALIDLVDWSTIHLGLLCALDDKVGLITTNWTTRYNSKMSVTFCAT